ncbi:MAG: acyltransferase [Phormidesmis sp. RL_2_1]|nr:acyltransferase [Phormidesmis sp. RL_2_1]
MNNGLDHSPTIARRLQSQRRSSTTQRTTLDHTQISRPVKAIPFKPRIASIEIFRIFAIIAVITLHSGPFDFANAPDYKHTIAVLIDLSCRFAVPFFFLTSGYFLAERTRAGQPLMRAFWHTTQRLLSVYAIWCLFYILVPLQYWPQFSSEGWLTMVGQYLQLLQSHGLNLLLSGTQQALWFLPALVIGLGITTGLIATGKHRYLIYTAVALYCIGLSGGSYGALLETIGAPSVSFSSRNGPFFSTLYVALGWLISTWRSQHRWPISTPWAIALIAGGLLLQIIEAKGIAAVAAVPFQSFDYAIGTVALGTGVFSLALAQPNWGTNWPILRWSRYTLGIYLFHPLVVTALAPMSQRYNHPLWEVSFPLIIYLLSLGIISVVARHPLLRRWVV